MIDCIDLTREDMQKAINIAFEWERNGCLVEDASSGLGVDNEKILIAAAMVFSMLSGGPIV